MAELVKLTSIIERQNILIRSTLDGVEIKAFFYEACSSKSE